MTRKLSKKQSTKTNAAFNRAAARRDAWQTAAPFDPAKTLDSLQTRYEKGKALRKQTPHESHATWMPAPDRVDPVATALVAAG